jgi:hypothetical protein
MRTEPKISCWRNKRASEKPDKNGDCHEMWEAVVVWAPQDGEKVSAVNMKKAQ